MNKSAIVLSLVTVGLLSACAPSVGTKPGDVPPKIIIDPQNEKNRIWDNPGAFGPVPQELAKTGQEVCATLDTKDAQYKAIGYHPLAKDMEGKPFRGGGYYCVTK